MTLHAEGKHVHYANVKASAGRKVHAGVPTALQLKTHVGGGPAFYRTACRQVYHIKSLSISDGERSALTCARCVAIVERGDFP